MKRIVLLILSAFFLTHAIAFSQKNSPGSEITKEEIYKHIQYLASDKLEGRFPGTAGDSLTGYYISNEFKRYKLSPIAENGYFEPFEMYTGVALSGENDFQIISDGQKNSYLLKDDFTPLGFSAPGRIEGPLVFAGYGISAPELNYDDYIGKDGNEIDVKDKIVVVMKYSPGGDNPHDNPFEKHEALRSKTTNAKKHSAAGIIFISDPDGGEDKLYKLAFDNSVKDGGIPVINCKREIIENLLNKDGIDLKQIQNEIDSLKSPGSFEIKNSSAIIEVNVKPVKVMTNNVIGFLEGSDPILKKEVIVIGAHKDHLGYGNYGSLYTGNDPQIHNGADDNASGVAGLLEIAQKLSSQKNKLKRSILFIAFGGEEAGLIGSAYFTGSNLFSKLNITSMLNMDMIGRLTDNKLIIYGTGTSPIWNNLIDSVNKTYNFSITKTPDGYGPSDHSSFYVKNIPVLHFFSGTHPDYHSPSDDLEKINTQGEVKIADMVYDIAIGLEKNPRPEFTKVAGTDNEKRSMGSVKVYVGTIPDYSYTGDGMKISGAKEGSPAEKGGMQAGDIITKFGDTDVKNIYDYMYGMGEYKPGDEVEIVVLRNNEKVTLKVVLGSR